MADRVRRDCDLIVHVAAVTGFDAPGKLLRAVNVDGTAHVLALAAGGARTLPVLHVSTAYVCGEVSGPVAEHDRPGAGPFANGYEATKADAEALAVQAGRDGVPVAIARPSIVVGAYADGAIRRPDGIYALIRLGAEGRVTALPARLGATLDLVPVDHVANGLLHLAQHMGQAAGRIVHLVSGRPVPVGMLAGLATEYPHLAAPRLIQPERFDPERLPPSAGCCTSAWRCTMPVTSGAIRASPATPCPPLAEKVPADRRGLPEAADRSLHRDRLSARGLGALCHRAQGGTEGRR